MWEGDGVQLHLTYDEKACKLEMEDVFGEGILEFRPHEAKEEIEEVESDEGAGEGHTRAYKEKDASHDWH